VISKPSVILLILKISYSKGFNMNIKPIKSFKLAFCTALMLATSASAMAEDVTIGYQGMFNPWKYAIAEKLIEKETGKTISWRRFDSGAKAMTAVASGDIDITVAGSSPIAAAVSRGIDIELVWILENIANAEALVVRNGSNINSPSDLKGKRLAVPFVSTTHFHTLFALHEFGLTEKDVKVLNMQPSAINSAWKRGDIDGAFIWDPVLGEIKKDGKVLISSATLGSWGKPTFDGLVVSKKFSKNNADFVTSMIAIIAAVDESYRQNAETITTANPIVKAIAKLSGGNAEGVISAASLYKFPTITEQTSCEWLGCGKEGKAAKALLFTSEFLKSQKKIRKLQKDYSLFVNPTYAVAASKKAYVLKAGM
jgi:taurine transport system substrate-binding protein